MFFIFSCLIFSTDVELKWSNAAGCFEFSPVGPIFEQTIPFLQNSVSPCNIRFDLHGETAWITWDAQTTKNKFFLSGMPRYETRPEEEHHPLVRETDGSFTIRRTVGGQKEQTILKIKGINIDTSVVDPGKDNSSASTIVTDLAGTSSYDGIVKIDAEHSITIKFINKNTTSTVVAVDEIAKTHQYCCWPCSEELNAAATSYRKHINCARAGAVFLGLAGGAGIIGGAFSTNGWSTTNSIVYSTFPNNTVSVKADGLASLQTSSIVCTITSFVGALSGYIGAKLQASSTQAYADYTRLHDQLAAAKVQGYADKIYLPKSIALVLT